jgi:metal-responsive CopG/Arc/MetJ family transcriptional regulator
LPPKEYFLIDMKRASFAIGERLLEQVSDASEKLGITKSEYIRHALIRSVKNQGAFVND